MKNVFGINKKETGFSYDKYIYRKLSEEGLADLEKIREKNNEVNKLFSLPRWLGWLSWILIMSGVVFILALFFTNEKFTEAYKRIGYILYIGIGLVVIGILIYVFLFIKGKKANKNPEVKKFIEESKLQVAKALGELEVPEDAKKIDVLFTMSKTTSKGEKLAYSSHFNQELYLFKEDDKLCLADIEQVLAFPIEAFTKIVKINKKIPLMQWNKEEDIKNEKYRNYDIRSTSGSLSIGSCYSVRLFIDEELEILIPNYDLENFLSVLELPVEERD